LTNNEWESLATRIHELVALQIWDKSTQESLAAYLSLRGAKYLFPENLDYKNRLTLAVMVNDEIRTITVP